MLPKTMVGLVYLASVASATFFPIMPRCWKKCARQAGLMCHWADLDCLCKAANSGILAAANSCACSSCEDWEFGNDDKAKLQLRELSGACRVAGTPFKDSAASAAFQAATCEGGSPSQESGEKPWPKPAASATWAPAPPAPWAPPASPAPSATWAPPAPPAPSATWAPPPGPNPSPKPDLSSTLTFSVPISVPLSVPPKPTSIAGPSSSAAPAPPPSPPRTGTTTAPASDYPTSTAYGSKSWGAPGVVGTSEAEWSTAVISSTVVVSPTPLYPQGGKTSTAATASTEKTASSSKSSKPSQFTGAASRRELHRTGSIFGIVAGVAYGILV